MVNELKMTRVHKVEIEDLRPWDMPRFKGLRVFWDDENDVPLVNNDKKWQWLPR